MPLKWKSLSPLLVTFPVKAHTIKESKCRCSVHDNCGTSLLIVTLGSHAPVWHWPTAATESWLSMIYRCSFCEDANRYIVCLETFFFSLPFVILALRSFNVAYEKANRTPEGGETSVNFYCCTDIFETDGCLARIFSAHFLERFSTEPSRSILFHYARKASSRGE